MVSRSITLEPRSRDPDAADRRVGLGRGLVDGAAEPRDRRLRRRGAARDWPAAPHVIVSIAGGALEAYVRMTGALQGRPDVAAIEVHLSAPDVELQRDVLGCTRDRAVEIVGAVARMSLVPVFAKIPLWASDVVELSRGAVRAGAHGLVVGGPPPALSVQARAHCVPRSAASPGG